MINVIREGFIVTDLERIEYTKAFIDKLANGINPLDDTLIPDNDLINNVRVSRCMFYVSDVLQHISDYLKNDKPLAKRKKKLPFTITPEQLQGYTFDDEPIYISKMAQKINALVNHDEVGNLSAKSITEWLINEELLVQQVSETGRRYKTITPQAEKLGASIASRVSKYGQQYTVILYNESAQKYILENIEAIIEINNQKISNAELNKENSWKPWTAEQDSQLTTMFQDGIIVSSIAAELKRTNSAVRKRLKALGLIARTSDAV